MWPPWAAVRPPAATGRPRRVPTASCGPPLQACPRLRPLVRADDAVPVEVETVEVGSSAGPFGAAQAVVTVAVESPEALLVAGRGAGVPEVHGLVAVLDRSDVPVTVAVQLVEALDVRVFVLGLFLVALGLVRGLLGLLLRAPHGRAEGQRKEEEG